MARPVAKVHDDDHASDGSPKLRADLARLRRSFRPWRRPMVLVLVLAVVTAALEAAIVLFIAAIGAALASGPDAVDRSLLGVEVDWSIRTLCVIVIALVVVRGAADLLMAWIKARTESSFDAELRREVAGAYLDADWALQSAEQSGGLQASLTTYVSMSRTLLSKTTDLAVATVSFGVMLVASVSAGGAVTAGVVVAMAVLAYALRPLVTANRRSSRHQRDRTGVFAVRVNEFVSMSREIRVMGIRSRFGERVDLDVDRLRSANRASASANYRLVSLHATVTYAAVGIGLTVLVFADVDDPQPYAAMVLLLYRAMIYGRSIQSTYQGMVGALPYLEELEGRLDRYRSARDVGGSVVVADLAEVRFDGVGYSYDGDHDALSDVSLAVGPGRAVGVVGPSGSGKSTFVQLLLGLRRPTVGAVTVDGVPVADIDPASWTRLVSFVPQESTLFDESVVDNVICLRAHVTRADALAALEAAFVLDELQALPDGVDTVVGEGGRRLSGGQRQRVCIARALAGRPRVLVLDEPTSALDLPSEEAIRLTLEAAKERMGLVIVAHRLSTLRICDDIAVINDGRLEAFADRATLEADNAYFAAATELAKLA